MLAQSKTKLEHENEELRKRLEIEDEVTQGLKKRLLVLSRRNTALRRATRSSSFSKHPPLSFLTTQTPHVRNPIVSLVKILN